MRRVTLLTRSGCHLCENARAVVQAVVISTGSQLTEVDVDQDQELRAEFGDMVPVVLIDGVQHGYFHIEADRLQRALLS